MKIVEENKLNTKLKLLIIIFIFLISILLDYKFRIANNSLNELVTIMFSTVNVIATIWITYYLLFFQLFKDRYPVKILKKKYLPKMRENFVMLAFLIISGCIIIVSNFGIFSALCFILLTLLTIIIILNRVYQTNKSLMINSYIDDYCSDIQNKIKNNIVVLSQETLKDIKYILDESVVKKEYFIAQNISEKMGSIFREFLKNSVGMISEGNSDESLEKSFNEIVNINIFQLELCEKIDSDILIKKILNQQILNLEFCIDSKQYDWFKLYFEGFNNLVFKLQMDDKEIFFNYILLYKKVVQKLINKEKNEWLKFMVDNINSMISSLNFLNKNNILKKYVQFLAFTLLDCLDETKSEFYDYFIVVIRDSIKNITKIKGFFNEVSIYYYFIFKELIKKDQKKAIEFVNDFFDNEAFNNDDSDLVIFKFFCLKELEDFKEVHLRTYHLKTISKVITMGDNYKNYIFLPEFKNEIFNNQYNKDLINNTCKDLEYLLHKCIVEDNVPIFLILLNKINDIIYETEIRQKDIQIRLFSIYIWAIKKTKNLNNKKFYEISFDMMEDTIYRMDKKANISRDFSIHIIESLCQSAKYAILNSGIIVLSITNLFLKFVDNDNQINFISSSPEVKKCLYRGLFNIGTDCIENNFEEGLRNVSNVIGWFIIYSIKQANSDLTLYLIDRARDLYGIAKKMDITSKTQTFMLTLFTTIGTFCCKDRSMDIYLKRIIESIKFEKLDKIKIAINLRTSENDMYNDLYENKTLDLTKKFLEECMKVIKD